MVEKNAYLEQKLKEKDKELDHVRSLLQSLTNFKENINDGNNSALLEKPQAFKFGYYENSIKKLNKPKTPKRVTFVDDAANHTIIEADLEENIEQAISLKNSHIFSARGTNERQLSDKNIKSTDTKSKTTWDDTLNDPGRSKSVNCCIVVNLKHSDSNYSDKDSDKMESPKQSNKSKTKPVLIFLVELNDEYEDDLELDSDWSDDSDSDPSSDDSFDSTSYKLSKTIEEDKNMFETPEKSKKSSNFEHWEIPTEVIFEDADHENESFEVHNMDTIEINQRKHNDLIKVENFDSSHHENSESRFYTMVSPASKLLKDPIGPRAKTLANKTIYHPKESTEYITNMLRSVNNKSAMFLNPAFDGTPNLENSIKKGRSYYNNNDDNEFLAYFSGSKGSIKATKLDLDILDQTVTRNLEDTLNNKSIRGEFTLDKEHLLEIEDVRSKTKLNKFSKINCAFHLDVSHLIVKKFNPMLLLFCELKITFRCW